MDVSRLNVIAKLAKVIDDDVERDEALCKVAQMQSAANDIEGAMKTIEQIRYVDIRADAWRKTLDNVLARYYEEDESNIPYFTELTNALISTTLEISNPATRQSKFFPMLTFTIPGMEAATAKKFLAIAQDEVSQIKNPVNRLFNLFGVSRHYQGLKEFDKASAALDLAQIGLDKIRPVSNQGCMVALLALEYWKIKDYMSAFDCIGRMKSRKGQTIAYQHLAELLAMGGLFKDAQSILDQMDNGVSKEIGQKVLAVGKQIYKMFTPEQRKSIVNFSELHPEDDSQNSEQGSENDSNDEDDNQSESSGFNNIVRGLNLNVNNVQLGVHIVNVDRSEMSEFDDEDSDDDEYDDSDNESDNDNDNSDDESDPDDEDDIIKSMEMFSPFCAFARRHNQFPGGPEDILKEKIADFNAKVEEVGFKTAWQEVLEQGDYRFAVDRALDYFQQECEEELVFGTENRLTSHPMEIG